MTKAKKRSIFPRSEKKPEGMDVCLVRMPFHLTFFGINKAGAVMKQSLHRGKG